MNIADFFGRYSKLYKDKAAVSWGQRVISYAEMADRVYRAANGLLELGVKPGDTVALLADNRPEFLEVFFARYIIGAVEATLNTKLTPQEWARQIHETNAVVVIGDHDLLKNLEAHKAEYAHVKHVLSFSDSHHSRTEYEALLAVSSCNPPEIDVDVSAQELCRVVYTGGTTGLPKGVMLSRAADLAQLRNILVDLAWDFTAQDVFLGMQPMYHAVRPFFFPCWMRGTTHVIIPDFRPKTAVTAIEKNGVTVVKTVPTALVRLLSDPEVKQHHLKSIRTIYYGGSPIAVEKLKEAIAVFGPIFVQNYGQTESAMTVCHLDKSDHVLDDPRTTARLFSIGRPYSWVEVKLVDEDGNAVPTGEAGELVVRGDHNMMGYLNRPDDTAHSLKNGWVHTRDIGRMDEDGYIYLLDRKGDLIITGGENVYPGEVEQLLYQHPAIIEACVFGIPDSHWGEAVTAAVSLKPNMQATEKDLIDFCKGQLARYKVPKKILFYESLPKSGPGKILRRELRDPFWQGHERAIH